MKKLILIVLVTIIAATVNATMITIAIEATVDTVSDINNELEGKITPGSIITGTYTYDTSTLDNNPASYTGDYWHYSAPYGVSLTTGGLTFQTDPTNVNFLIELVNDGLAQPFDDAYLFRSYNNSPLTNGAIVDHISWFLSDPMAQALSDATLSGTAPILSDWETSELTIQGDRRSSFFDIDATVTSAVVVPEPATLLLFTVGTILITSRRKDKN